MDDVSCNPKDTSVDFQYSDEFMLDESNWLNLLDQLLNLIESQAPFNFTSNSQHSEDEALTLVCKSIANCIGLDSIKFLYNHESHIIKNTDHLIRPKKSKSNWPAILAQNYSIIHGRQKYWLQVLADHVYFWMEQKDNLLLEEEHIIRLYQTLDAGPSPIIALDINLDVHFINKKGRDLLNSESELNIKNNKISIRDNVDTLLDQIKYFDNNIQLVQHLFEEDRFTLTCYKINTRNKCIDTGLLSQTPDLQYLPNSSQFHIVIIIHQKISNDSLLEIRSIPSSIDQILEEKFKLSEKESLLIWNLGLGLSPQQFAKIKERSIETIRSQIKSSYKKIGVNDQHGLSIFIFDLINHVQLNDINQHSSYTLMI